MPRNAACPVPRPLAPADTRGGGSGTGIVAGSEGAKLAVSARPDCSKAGSGRAGWKLRGHRGSSRCIAP